MLIKPTYKIAEEQDFEGFLDNLGADQIRLWHNILEAAKAEYARPGNEWMRGSNAHSYILRMQNICAEKLDKHYLEALNINRIGR